MRNKFGMIALPGQAQLFTAPGCACGICATNLEGRQMECNANFSSPQGIRAVRGGLFVDSVFHHVVDST
jgi:hypothetical protein